MIGAIATLAVSVGLIIKGDRMAHTEKKREVYAFALSYALASMVFATHALTEIVM